MTNPEFSNEFDVYYNNITSNQAPGLDEYEKSVFLTRAQDDVLKAYFNPRSNKPQQGYDGSEIRQIDFSMVTVVKEYTGDTLTAAIFDPRENSKSVALATDILMLINEQLIVTRDGKTEYLQVVPVMYDEYRRLMSKPFKRPIKFQAWRLLNTSNGSNKADLIIGPNDTISKYSIRYVKRPRPIILSRLDSLTLDGYVGAKEDGTPTKIYSEAVSGISCELDPILHHEILQRAVELAKAAYIGDLQSQVALGQTSQTNIGMVAQSG